MANALDLALVEEELRAAEAYLSHRSAVKSANERPSTYAASESGKAPSFDTSTSAPHRLERPHTRPVISEERRKQILAKLSSERRTTERHKDQHHVGDGETLAESPPRETTLSPLNEDAPSRIFSDAELESLLGSPVQGSPDRRSSVVSDRTSDGSIELFYACDVLGNPPSPDTGILSRLLHTEIERREADSTDDYDYGAFLGDHSMERYEIQSAQSLASKLFASPNNKTTRPQMATPTGSVTKSLDHSYQGDHYDAAIDVVEPARVGQARVYNEVGSLAFDHDEPTVSVPTTHDMALGPARKKILSRIDVLAQSRRHVFVEREKRRLQLEVEQFRECTFKPNLSKIDLSSLNNQQRPHKASNKNLNDHQYRQPQHTSSSAFPWLTLSPRLKGYGRYPHRLTWDGQVRERNQNVIERLHLDGTARFEARERAKEALEIERLRSCTFKPTINSVSRSLAFATNHKPIHQRLSELQRNKEERAQRTREELELESQEDLSFTPTINSKSREIADAVLIANEKTRFINGEEPSAKPQDVTDRLAAEAETLLERRTAIQEYYDELERQPYAPTINDKSENIVKHKPEFLLDFVARQDYFQTREQERRKALEDVCGDGHDVSFTPDIGNADEILTQLRPDIAHENRQQKLYRLIYQDPKNLELKKQQMREQEYAKYSFKPAINPVSRVLGRPSTLDQLSRPNAGFQEQSQRRQQIDGPRSVPNAREATKQYFAGKRFRSKVALEMEQAERAECTFQPTLVAQHKPRGMCASTSKLETSSTRKKGNVWNSANLLQTIEANRQRKDEEMQARRDELALRELKECTFRPNVRRASDPSQGRREAKKKASSLASPRARGRDNEFLGQREEPRDAKPIIVRGLGRFLELREKAKQQQIEQRQREQHAFQLNPSSEPRSYTVPQPFRLSTSSRLATDRQLRAREQMRAREQAECTFHPKTLESQKRKVLRQMLKD